MRADPSGYDSYLNFDNPVVLNLNPFFLLEDDPTPARNNQVTRAASLIVSALEFVRAVRKEELPPDTVKGTPLCMHQYSRLFGTARVPTDQGCQIEQDPESKHIVVMCHGQFYWFDVLDDVLRVFAVVGRTGLPWRQLPELLAKHVDPDTYARHTPESMSALLRGLGVPSVDIKVDGKGIKGCRLDDVRAAHARAELTATTNPPTPRTSRE